MKRAKTAPVGAAERGGPWRLLAAHQTCSPDRMVFVRREAEEGGTIRMHGVSSSGEVW